MQTSLPDSATDYSFDSYINWRLNIDYYDDDAFLKKALEVYADENWFAADEKARITSVKASRRWREFSEISACIENRPKLLHFDAFNQRIDRIQRCEETEHMEKEIFGLGLFSADTSAWQKLIQLLLIYENGESCISCPLACTDGLASLLDRYAVTPELLKIRAHIKEGINGEYAIASQFITEIRGGSDITSNRVKAIEKYGQWRLYGKKFFCSAAHADYFLVTAKPSELNHVAAFVVPAWQNSDAESRLRNNYFIDRLKPKMGTCELPTAEISFDGALAYPVTPMDKAVSQVVGIVLACTRINIGIFSAAIMLRAVREATYYAQFREAFGQSIAQFPMLASQLDHIRLQACRTTAGFFKLYRHLINLDGGLLNDNDASQSIDQRRHLFEIRELIMLQKIVAAADSVDTVRTAISVFGGHGVIEDFSSLPRLFRDAMVNELWEGPRNVLFAQIYRDFKLAGDWYPADEFVNRILQGSNSIMLKQLSRDMLRLVAGNDNCELGTASIEHCQEWEYNCILMFHAYQDNALLEVEKSV